MKTQEYKMTIDFNKKVFTIEETKFIEGRLKYAEKQGVITQRTEKNSSLKVSYQGTSSNNITYKWNVKVYNYNLKKGGHSIETNDYETLKVIVEKEYENKIASEMIKLSIDDAGGGFPLLGVMIGVSDNTAVKTDIVPVEYFQDDSRIGFKSGKYLEVYSDKGIKLIEEFDATPKTHYIEICTGYINFILRDKLRKLGYKVIPTEIAGMLQSELELTFKEYVNTELTENLYYDPKDMSAIEILKKYHQCLDFGINKCPEKLKSGWPAIQQEMLRRQNKAV